jgi:drug/metabolite transporter (DMT)-like permease
VSDLAPSVRRQLDPFVNGYCAEVAIAPVGIALAGALFVALGFVLQQHVAAQEPPDERLSFRLLTRLVQRPIWLCGMGSLIVGQLLGATALSRGSLALVIPVMATNLVFALPLAAVWHRRRLAKREWVGAVAVIGGLALFIAAGDPYGGHSQKLPWPNWVVAVGSIVIVAGVLAYTSRRTSTAKQATLLALGAGVLYGLQDALTQRMLASLEQGFVDLFTTWPVYGVVTVAVVALLLGQSAFEAAPLPASLPAMTVAEPITAIAFGVGVYAAHLNLGWPSLILEILGLTSMAGGVQLIVRSPLITPAAEAETGEWYDAA